jgi:ribonuclease BN (tRNA processing enzyme)
VKVTILGCSGGIGGGRHTTSLLVDDDILIDAGSGVTKLSPLITSLSPIRIWITFWLCR